jgi:hypothetical protein
MVLRWIAAGMGEARRQFRRVNGHLHLAAYASHSTNHRRCHTEQGGCRLISPGRHR